MRADRAFDPKECVFFDLVLHRNPPERRAQLTFDHELGDGCEDVERGADAGHDQPHREDPSTRAERLHLFVADGGDGDDGHVERVER